MTSQPQSPPAVSIAFTVKELEKMLANAKAGGSVEVIFTTTHTVVLR